MKKALVTLAALATISATAFAYYNYRKGAPAPTVSTAPLVRGDIVDTVGATGTLQAVTTVQVGTQVSGIIQDLYADFNSLVKKGQILARLDPSSIQTEIDQSKANLLRSQADLERLKVAADDAKLKLARSQELSTRNLIPTNDLETAEATARGADAQVKSAEAAVTQAQASLKQNQVNLDHTVIEAPIDGLVISRNVDRGQTVAASMQAPTLFVLAADLTKMQVVANLDESDVGRIRPGQVVTFRVDAYPSDTFTGSVAQVRLQPIVQQNVVTYATVIDVPNPDLKLKPGMTANVNIEIARRTNVLRIPNAALRFRPTNEIFAALGQTPPAGAVGAQAGGRRGAGQSGAAAGAAGESSPASGAAAAGAATAKTAAGAVAPSVATGATASAPARENPGAAEGSGAPGASGSTAAGRGGNADAANGAGGRAGGRGVDPARLAERMQNMSADEKAQFVARMKARGIEIPAAAAAPAATGAAKAAGAPAAAGGGASLSARNPAATTIDALFGPLTPVVNGGRLWIYVDKQLKPVRVRTGISDGQATELIEGGLDAGTEVVTNVTTGTETRPAAAAQGFPFGQQGRGTFPGANRAGGGRQ